MSSSAQSPLPPADASLPAAGNPALAALPADGRVRVLCPGGLKPAATWPAGAKPLMAYVIYAPLAAASARKPS